MVELSVIIHSYNRASLLQICLQTLAHQTQRTSDFEVIVVADGSTETTRELLANLKTPYLLRVIWQDNQGRCAALNRGIRAARGRFCLFLDDGISAAPSLVAEHLRAQHENKGIVGIGQITFASPPDADWFAHLFTQDLNDHYEQLNKGRESLTWEDCYSGNLSVPHAALLEISGFAADLPAMFDIELGCRLQRHGLSFVYIPKASGIHNAHKSYRELTLEAEQQGAAAVEIYRRHPSNLPRLLGTYNGTHRFEILLRRFLLRLDLPLRALGLVRLFSVNPSWIGRWFHFLHRYYYWRGVRRAVPDQNIWQRLTESIPILMYHAFTEADRPTGRYTVSARQFRKQMAWLKKKGYHILSLEQYLGYRHENRLPPIRSVVITIDDGYKDVRTIAYPILRAYGYPATIFLVSERIGSTNEWDTTGELAGRPLLSWLDIEDMVRGGMQVGAHTLTHTPLFNMPKERIREEVEGSRIAIEGKLGIPVRTFAYPFGKCDAEAQQVIQEAGFLGSCGIHEGINTPLTPLHNLRRVEIHGKDKLIDFILKVKLGAKHFWGWNS